MAAIWRSFTVTRIVKTLHFQEKHILKCSISSTRFSQKASRFSALKDFYKRSSPKTAAKPRDATALSGNQLVPVVDEPAMYTQSPEEIPLETKEKFIPLTRHQLVNGLSKERKYFSPSEINQMEKLAVSLDTYIARRFYIQLEELKLLYDVMDPDKDTVQLNKVSTKQLLDDEYWFLQKLETLLCKANYYQIPRPQVIQLLQSHDVSEGVRVTVDPLKYSVLRMWTRGKASESVGMVQRLKHRARRMFSRTSDSSQSPFECYTRVFIAVRSKNSKMLHLKIFKDVPCTELEYLVPDGKIEMSNFDKGFLMSSAFLGTLAICAKLFTIAADLKLDLGLIGLCIAGIIGTRGWVGYKNKRNKYLVNLSRTLYFKTVANNRGVLTLMTDRAEDEEFKETLLAYMFLLSPPNRRGVPGTAYTPESPGYHTQESLRDQVQKWLLDSFGFDKVAFDVEDALSRLDKMGLLVRHADDTYSVVPLDIALDILPIDPLITTTTLRRDDKLMTDNVISGDDDMKHYSGWQ